MEVERTAGKVSYMLWQLPSGERYEDRYGGYIKLFEEIAHTPGKVRIQVHGAPASWVPLLLHLNCDVMSTQGHFEHCNLVHAALSAANFEIDRTALEVLCSFRPETADCLWKVDVQWAGELPEGRVKTYPWMEEFIVTTNGAYHRKEVLAYLQNLRDYTPSKKKVLLVPCAADKPYPSPMHKACLELLPDDFYLMNATGVLGLVPQDLWPIMPHYDSGIPNQWRLYSVVKEYFRKNPHERVVVYCDFYNKTIASALAAIDQPNVQYVLPLVDYDDYEDLGGGVWLSQLKADLSH